MGDAIVDINTSLYQNSTLPAAAIKSVRIVNRPHTGASCLDQIGDSNRNLLLAHPPRAIEEPQRVASLGTVVVIPAIAGHIDIELRGDGLHEIFHVVAIDIEVFHDPCFLGELVW